MGAQYARRDTQRQQKGRRALRAAHPRQGASELSGRHFGG
jgi:hypothetical protein